MHQVGELNEPFMRSALVKGKISSQQVWTFGCATSRKTVKRWGMNQETVLASHGQVFTNNQGRQTLPEGCTRFSKRKEECTGGSSRLGAIPSIKCWVLGSSHTVLIQHVTACTARGLLRRCKRLKRNQASAAASHSVSMATQTVRCVLTHTKHS